MIIQKEVEYAKETGDVMDLVVEIIKVVKNGGDYESLVDDLIDAISGIEDIPNEAKNIEAMINAVAPKIYSIVKAFVPVKK